MKSRADRRVRRASLALVLAGLALLTACSGTGGSAQAAEPLGAAEFRSAAASACAEVVSYRRYELTTYPDDLELALQAVLLSLDKPADAEPEDIAAAIGRLADESRRTADQLAQVRASDPADQKLWDSVVRSQRDRAALLDRRREAVQAGRYSDIEQFETDEQLEQSLTGLGLQDRDCARMDAG